VEIDSRRMTAGTIGCTIILTSGPEGILSLAREGQSPKAATPLTSRSEHPGDWKGATPTVAGRKQRQPRERTCDG
jgi:hypothetical protein